MPITATQALEALASDDLIGLGMEAGAARRRLHPEPVVSYTVEIAVPLGAAPEPILNRADRLGATDFVLRSDLANPQTLTAIEALLHRLRRELPTAGLHGLTATDILRLAASEALPPADILRRLAQAGFASLRGDDALILDQTHRPAEFCSAADWLALHRLAHTLGLPTTASLTFGHGEDHAARVAHLTTLSQLQQETGGFIAFTAHAWSPEHAIPGHRTLDEATAVDYLKTLAVSRLLLDTIPHLTVDPTQGLKVTQMALRFGADDAGPILTDEHTIALAGPSNCATEEELRRLIRDAGFMPVQRGQLFRLCYLV